MKPTNWATNPKDTWHVYTTNELQRTASSSPTWAWVAHGPRGSESGVEGTAEAAVHKAVAASMLLAEPA